MLHLITEKVTAPQLHDMLLEYNDMIKIVVDIRRSILAGGGIMHADCETLLLNDGSEQDDLWGANWYPNEHRLAYESLINIRPRLGNRSLTIQDEKIRQHVLQITHSLLGECFDR